VSLDVLFSQGFSRQGFSRQGFSRQGLSDHIPESIDIFHRGVADCHGFIVYGDPDIREGAGQSHEARA
jgi:hypothetical protein